MALFNRNSIHVCPKLLFLAFYLRIASFSPFFFLASLFLFVVVVVVIRVFDGLGASPFIVVVLSFGNVKL